MTRRLSGSPRAALAALTALLGVGLAGCAADPTAAPEAAESAHPVVTARQAEQILTAIDTTLVRAMSARDQNLLGVRVVGPARDAAVAALLTSGVTKAAPTVPPAPAGSRALLLPIAQGWPRWFAEAGATAAAPAPVIRVVMSTSARAPYGIWAQLTMLPGATLPDVASPTVGLPLLDPTAGAAAPGAAAGPSASASASGSPSSSASPAASTSASARPATAGTGLLGSPLEVATRYADLLTRGDASPYRTQFGADAFRRQVAERLAADQAGAAGTVASLTSVHAVAPGGVLAARTKDGGALVIARLDQTYTLKVAPGRAITLDRELAALAGRPTITGQLVRTSVEVLAFHVPPASAGTPVEVLAASKAQIRAAGT